MVYKRSTLSYQSGFNTFIPAHSIAEKTTKKIFHPMKKFLTHTHSKRTLRKCAEKNWVLCRFETLQKFIAEIKEQKTKCHLVQLVFRKTLFLVTLPGVSIG